MSVQAPHFLLYAEAAQAFAGSDSAAGESLAGAGASGLCATGRWRFVIRSPGGPTALEAADEEPEASVERLELLAIVRGLEALEQPSRVTLMSGSRHLRRGLQFGLPQWRESDWQWERYGRMTPVKNGDLWRRLDRLIEIHAVECRQGALEKANDLATPPAALGSQCRPAQPKRLGRRLRIDSGHLAAGKAESGGSAVATNSTFKNRRSPGRQKAGPYAAGRSALAWIMSFALRTWRLSDPPQGKRLRLMVKS
jgi:ribonuclease HI